MAMRATTTAPLRLGKTRQTRTKLRRHAGTLVENIIDKFKCYVQTEKNTPTLLPMPEHQTDDCRLGDRP